MRRRLADPTFQRFLRFLVVGLVNTGFSFAIYSLLVLAGLAAQPALAISWGLGVLWNFATHGRFVFGRTGLGRLPAYVLTYVAIFVMNSAALEGLLRLGLHPILAQGLLMPLVAVLSFVLISRALTGRFPRLGEAEKG